DYYFQVWDISDHYIF
nr:immunoglobulin light chain junction region [Macaca mulatta]